MNAPPILIVDDNPTNLKLVQVLLEEDGLAVRTAVDAAGAIEAVAESPPRLLLLDLQLPGMDGLALTRLLKGAPATRDIVILAMTAYAMKGDAERARAAGCDGYITKPIDTRSLAGLVRGYLAAPAPGGRPA